jgi:hypothetical protein
MEYSAIDGGERVSLGLGEEGWRGNGMGRGWGGQTFFAGGVEVEPFKEVIHGCGWTGPLLGQTTKVPALRCARRGVEKRCGVV